MNKENRKNKEKERETIERGSNERKNTKLGKLLVDSNSSVEVGYGFHAFIVNSQ